jgi:hypothetical protein
MSDSVVWAQAAASIRAAREAGCFVAFWMSADPPQVPPDIGGELWVLTQVIDSSDSYWNTSSTVVATPQKMAAMFDLRKLPYGVRLLKGKAAKRYLKWAAKEEARYQREQISRGKMNGEN